MATLDILSHGIPFTVRLVQEGEQYGLRDCYTHDNEDPLVEFYDKRYAHTEFGQFITRYSLSTLLDNTSTGLNLYGGEPQWSIDEKDMKEVVQWLKNSLINQYLDNIQTSSTPKLK